MRPGGNGGKYRHWDMTCMGYKGNMFDIQAALLLPQLPRLKKTLKRDGVSSSSIPRPFSQQRGLIPLKSSPEQDTPITFLPYGSILISGIS